MEPCEIVPIYTGASASIDTRSCVGDHIVESLQLQFLETQSSKQHPGATAFIKSLPLFHNVI